MNLDQLRKQAQIILDLKPVDGFDEVKFSTSSGGVHGHKILAETDIIRSSEEFAYDTQANGEAFVGELVVSAKKTGALDSESREIYITPSGVVFVEEYYAGSPASFDSGRLVAPKFE